MAGPYQTQLSPAGGSDFSGAPAGGIGQPIANALEYGGELMDKEIHRRKELDRDMQATTAGVQLAQASSAIDKAAIDARESAGPGGAGHTQNIDQLVDTQAQQALGSIRDPHVREQFTQRWADLKGQISTREYGWEAGQRVNYITSNVKEATDTYARSQAASPDVSALPNQLAAIHSTIYSTTGLTDDQKHALAVEQQRAVVLGYAQAAVTTDPTFVVGDAKKGTKGLLQSPDFNQYLQPDDIKSITSAGGVEIRRRDAEERQQLARATAQAREDVGLFKTKIGDGYVPTDEEWKTYGGLAQQYKLEGDQWNLGVLKDQADINREYRTATPATLHHDINELQAKVASGKATDAESVHLKNLTAFAGPAIQRFNSDPFAAAAAAGNPAPDIGDLANPDAGKVQARVAWARAYAASSGLVNVPYLSNDEAKIFSDRIKEGPAGQISAAMALHQAFGPAVATQVAKQLAPGDRGLELMVQMNPRVAELYSRGLTAVAAKTVHLGSTQDQQTGQDDRQAMNDIFNAYADAIPVDLQPAFRSAADNIAAGIAAEFGHHEPTGDDLKIAYSGALQRAGGRLGSVSDWNAGGGFAEYKGRYVWLPPSVNSNQFINAVSRAGKEQWIKAGAGQPYYLGSDGKLVPFSDAQMGQLSNYRLVPMRGGEGTYQLVDPTSGGHVLTKDRKLWQFDIRKLR